MECNITPVHATHVPIPILHLAQIAFAWGATSDQEAQVSVCVCDPVLSESSGRNLRREPNCAEPLSRLAQALGLGQWAVPPEMVAVTVAAQALGV